MNFSNLARWTCAAAIGSAVLVGEVTPPQSWSSQPQFTLGEAAHAKRGGSRISRGPVARSVTEPNQTTTSRPANAQPSLTTYLKGLSQTIDRFNWLLLGGAFVSFMGFQVVSLAHRRDNLPPPDWHNEPSDEAVMTVSVLQVALFADAEQDIQTQLAKFSVSASLNQQRGLFQLLESTCLTLLRVPELWGYGNGESQTLISREAAMSYFNTCSLEERSHFSLESFIDLNGNLQQRIDQGHPEISGQYVVVTLVAATTTDSPLYGVIRSKEELQTALTKLATVPADSLLRMEVMWTPQAAPETLTSEELIFEYPDLMVLT